MYTIDILTLFPGSVTGVLGESIVGRSQERGNLKITAHQIRDFTTNRQNQVDDYPYGGGRGCVMQIQPLYDAWKYAKSLRTGRLRTIYLSPCGKTFTEAEARRLATEYDGLILVCGHYEGVDERFITECVDEEISLGDFVLTGGEIPAMAVADAVSRLIPGTLPDAECYEEESHWSGLLEYPQFSRPEKWHGMSVPPVLLSGNHAEIARWRKKESIKRTYYRRPDMYARLKFETKQEKKLHAEVLRELEEDKMDAMLNKYARLIVRKGINLQKNQTLVIRCPIDQAAFARLITEEAYEAGARDVIVRWSDEFITRQHYLNAADEVFDETRPWEAEMLNTLAEKGAAFLSVVSEDPDAFEGVDPSRLGRAAAAQRPLMKPYRARLNADKNQWCVAAVPNPAWAKKVFPGKSEEDAVKALWRAIYRTVRLTADNDPVEEWDKHVAELLDHCDKLNKYAFKYLRYSNSLGTDLTVELPEGHYWEGGRSLTGEGLEFLPNMPTEEVFTAPKRDAVNGVVYAAKPLVLNGTVVDKFGFRLENGRIVDVFAEKGLEVLKTEVDTDEGSHYLGEVALVPYDSPISKSGILFYDTLFDENAACHFAFGSAYPTIEGGKDMTREELLAHGLNDSLTHVDFMVGTSDLSVTGITKDGKEIAVFRDGNFAF